MSKFNILPQFHDYMLEFTQCFVYFFLLCNDKNKSILILTICTVKTCSQVMSWTHYSSRRLECNNNYYYFIFLECSNANI